MIGKIIKQISNDYTVKVNDKDVVMHYALQII